ncbi:flagellin lysine-N-methylase [Erwinia sp. QL-Z3]|uniref:flagellin lysine-N-methylase n=1 Tax=Erwinia sp. QL-Z3 TaxID=2547962 RepID=UPI001070A09C|nr:flagellin lysine-N-methylase [Erwinia sp. QL-Z3]QBR52172.1 lysine-N-methylase fliB [Erwinia sp. QL-Z3]
MKEISVIEPLFVTSFKCIGSECRDHCCKGWDITLDKTTVNRYLKSSQIEIRNIASGNIITTKESFANWGKMKLSKKGDCAFLDESSLCKVHKNLGASALSTTCSTYPRQQKTYRSEINKSITLSCPEAAKKLLSEQDAMLFSCASSIQGKLNNMASVDQEQRLVNLMCANLIKVSQANVANGLYGIAILLVHFDKMKSEDRFSADVLEQAYLDIINSIEQGGVSKSIAELNSNHELQWALLMRMQTYFGAKFSGRALSTFNHYLEKLIYIQASGAEINDVASSMKRLDSVWSAKVSPWLSERPHLMSNYLQYRIYNDVFPGYEGRSPLASLYLLTAEWFLIKSLISACAELVGDVHEEDVINIIYSFHAVTKHSSTSTAAFFEEIDKVKVNDDLSLIFLLK